MKRRRIADPHEIARRRWGRVRVVTGGLLRPSKRKRVRAPGTAAERRLVERILVRSLSASEMADAIKLLRAGARVKEVEISRRIESLLDPERT